VSPFIVLSLPRSRSYWLSRLLDYPGVGCGHDTLVNCRRVEDFFDNFYRGLGGTVETAGMLGAELMRARYPDARFVVIVRSPVDVATSLARFNISDEQAELKQRQDMLLQVAQWPGTWVIPAQSLDDDDTVKSLFEHCTGKPFDWEWYGKFKGQNLQINMPARFDFLARNHALLEGLKAEARELTAEIGKPGLIVRPESWRTIWPEVDTLGTAHFKEVNDGVVPQRPYKLNAPMLEAMYKAGHFKVITARLDGRLIGYLTWQISPDVESVGITEAQQGAWFVEPGHPRVAAKLFDVSMGELKKWGVQVMTPHHRLQGRGARLDKFFRSRGAVETQRNYSLWIGS